MTFFEFATKWSPRWDKGYANGIHEGWIPMVDALLTELDKKDPEQKIRIQQVKEKFGGLRLYWSFIGDPGSDGLYEWFEKAVDALEDRSFTVCEACGEPGTTGGKGWLTTLCEPCRKETNK